MLHFIIILFNINYISLYLILIPLVIKINLLITYGSILIVIKYKDLHLMRYSNK